MRVQSNWSKAGLVIGFIWAIGFAYRYLFRWGDYSQAILFIGLGVGLICISWLYDKQLNLRNTIDALQEYIVDKENAKNKR